MSKSALINGRVHTASGLKEAVLIENGIIVEAGTDSEIKLHKDAEIIDLKGRAVFPGFSDSHMHFMSWARSQEIMQLSPCKNINDIRETVKNFIARNPMHGGEWIRGRGWNHVNLEEKRMPEKKDLDDIVPQNPVILTRVCGHVAVLNSAALKLLGINKDTHIEGGIIGLGVDGEPNGLISEEAVGYAEERIPALQDRELDYLLGKYALKAASFGITQLNSDDLGMFSFDFRRAISFYMQASLAGKLPFRLRQQFLLPQYDQLMDFLSEGWRSGDGNPLYQIGPMKLLCDGSLGGRTAFLKNNYADVADTRGVAIYEQEELNRLICTAHSAGMQIATHAIGDGALEMCLNAFEKAQEQQPRAARHLIVHAQIADDRQLERMKNIKLNAAIQPCFVPSDREMALERLGKNRAERSYRWKTMLKKGIVLSGGSDAPIESLRPLDGIQAAVTRQDLHNKPEGGWVPAECLSVAEAINLYTWAGAWNTFSEHRRGDIQPGRDADLVVLAEDPFLVPCEEISQIKVAMTICAAKVTFRSADFN